MQYTDQNKMNFGKQGCKVVTNISNTYVTNYWYIFYHGSSQVGTIEAPSFQRGRKGKNLTVLVTIHLHTFK